MKVFDWVEILQPSQQSHVELVSLANHAFPGQA